MEGKEIFFSSMEMSAFSLIPFNHIWLVLLYMLSSLAVPLAALFIAALRDSPAL